MKLDKTFDLSAKHQTPMRLRVADCGYWLVGERVPDEWAAAIDVAVFLPRDPKDAASYLWDTVLAIQTEQRISAPSLRWSAYVDVVKWIRRHFDWR